MSSQVFSDHFLDVELDNFITKMKYATIKLKKNYRFLFFIFFHLPYKEWSVMRDRLTWYLPWGTCKERSVNFATAHNS
jgi:hypothetical protein